MSRIHTVLVGSMLGLAIVAPVGAFAQVVPAATSATQETPNPETSILAGKKISVEGLAEFRIGDAILIDGYRVMVTPATVYTDKAAATWDDIALGYAVKVKGQVQRDGSLVATEIAAKPRERASKGLAVVRGALAQEGNWLSGGGSIFKAALEGNSTEARLPKADPQYERVKTILERIAPSYIEEPIRLHLINSPDWNARALPNGSIAVASGLLKDMDDDEIAIVVGHELAHFTHEHAQKTQADAERRKMFTELAADVATGGTVSKLAVMAGSALALKVWQSGYSRSLEAEADRVGLSYAAAGGFDVRKAPKVWTRFQEKYGNANLVKNLVVGEHPRNSDRAQNASQELLVKYKGFAPNPNASNRLPGAPSAVLDPSSMPTAAVSDIGGTAATVAQTSPKVPNVLGTSGGAQFASGATPSVPVPRSTEISAGMTQQQVRALLGAPKKELVFKAAAGTQSKWIYEELTVVFANGKVVNVEF